MTPKRTTPPKTRKGITHKIELRGANVYVTLNRIDGPDSLPCDILATINNECDKAPIDPGHQAYLHCICRLGSELINLGMPIHVLASRLRDYQFEPSGGPGVGTSVLDAIGRWLEKQEEGK